MIIRNFPLRPAKSVPEATKLGARGRRRQGPVRLGEMEPGTRAAAAAPQLAAGHQRPGHWQTSATDSAATDSPARPGGPAGTRRHGHLDSILATVTTGLIVTVGDLDIEVHTFDIEARVQLELELRYWQLRYPSRLGIQP